MRLLAAVVVVACCIGCQGVEFASSDVANSLPTYFKARNVYPDDSGIMKYKLTELAGIVLHEAGNPKKYTPKGLILKSGYSPKLEIIQDEDGKVYSATVDRGASGEGSYLAFAASLSANQVASVEIRDRNIVYVSNADAPWPELKTEAAKGPIPGTKRYWVQGALIATIDAKRFTQIKADAKGVVGDTFGAKGNVYNKRGSEIHDYRISLRLVDLDELDQSIKANPDLDVRILDYNTGPAALFPTGVRIDNLDVDALERVLTQPR